MLTLIKIQILSFFGINKALHATDKKQKRKFILFSAGMILLFAYFLFLSFLYSKMMATSLSAFDAVPMLFASMVSATSFVTFLTTTYKVDGALFGFRDYDMVMSLPVKVSSVVASRIVMLYTISMLFTLLFMLPAGIVYATEMAPKLLFYPIFVVVLIMMPIVPIIFATACGLAISAISSRFRRKNIINILLSLILVVGIVAFSQMSAGMTGEDLAEVGSVILSNAQRLYPLTALYVNALTNTDLLALGILLAINIVAFVGFCAVVGRFFVPLNSRLGSAYTRKNYKIGKLSEGSAATALFKKEWRRYISSPIYVLNTSIGVVLLTIASVGLLFFSGAQLEAFLDMPGLTNMLAAFSPLVLAGMLCLSPTTSASISLEGSTLWIAKSCPVSEKIIFHSKILLNLAIIIPAAILNGIIFAIILKPDPISLVFFFVTPIVYALFSSTLGIFANLLFPILEWRTPTTPVKQSMSVLVSIFAGGAAAALPIFLFFYFEMLNSALFMTVTTLIVLVLTIALYALLMKKGAALWRELG